MSDFGGDFRVTLRFAGAAVALVLPQGVLGEVLLDTPVAPLPRAPDWVKGLVSVRGDVLPVLAFDNPWDPQTAAKNSVLISFRFARESFAVSSDGQINFDRVRYTSDAATVDMGSAFDGYCGRRCVVGESGLAGVEFDVMRWGRERRYRG